MYNVSDIFKKITLCCLNHTKPKWVPMTLIKNTDKVKSPFYACYCYPHDNSAIDEIKIKKPAGMSEDDTKKWEEKQQKKAAYLKSQSICFNRISVDDFTNLVLKLVDKIGTAPFADWTNYKFYFKGPRHKYEAIVLKYTPDELRLGILNITATGVATTIRDLNFDETTYNKEGNLI